MQLIFWPSIQGFIRRKNPCHARSCVVKAIEINFWKKYFSYSKFITFSWWSHAIFAIFPLIFLITLNLRFQKVNIFWIWSFLKAAACDIFWICSFLKAAAKNAYLCKYMMVDVASINKPTWKRRNWRFLLFSNDKCLPGFILNMKMNPKL